MHKQESILEKKEKQTRYNFWRVRSLDGAKRVI